MNADLTPGQQLSAAVDPLEEERSRLETDLAVARARVLAARHAAADLDARTKQALRDELAASRAQLAELERRHEDALRELREGTAAEVERIRAAAQQRVAEIEAATVDAPAVEVPT
jgi:predicted  nucleic acid-binding Zn-ribbon protein